MSNQALPLPTLRNLCNGTALPHDLDRDGVDDIIIAPGYQISSGHDWVVVAVDSNEDGGVNGALEWYDADCDGWYDVQGDAGSLPVVPFQAASVFNEAERFTELLGFIVPGVETATLADVEQLERWQNFGIDFLPAADRPGWTMDRLRAALQALELIRETFGDEATQRLLMPDERRLRVIDSPMRPRLSEYESNPDYFPGRYVPSEHTIYLNTVNDSFVIGVLTFVHEFGHVMDFGALQIDGLPFSSGSPDWGYEYYSNRSSLCEAFVSSHSCRNEAEFFGELFTWYVATSRGYTSSQMQFRTPRPSHFSLFADAIEGATGVRPTWPQNNN